MLCWIHSLGPVQQGLLPKNWAGTFVGIEQDKTYIKAAKARIDDVLSVMMMM